jgi:hypothetical protein
MTIDARPGVMVTKYRWSVPWAPAVHDGAVFKATDAEGNPLNDFLVAPNDQTLPGAIPCGDAACPAHMRTVAGVKYSSSDVVAWADLWFYSNPVYVEVLGSSKVAGVK